jgi:hypothetical protein
MIKARSATSSPTAQRGRGDREIIDAAVSKRANWWNRNQNQRGPLLYGLLITDYCPLMHWLLKTERKNFPDDQVARGPRWASQACAISGRSTKR